LGLFYDIFGGGSSNTSGLMTDAEILAQQGLGHAPGSCVQITSGQANAMSNGTGGYGNYSGLSSQGNYANMVGSSMQQASQGLQQLAMQQAAYQQQMAQRPRTTVVFMQDGIIEIINGRVIHSPQGLQVVDDLYIEAPTGSSLHDIEKTIKSVRGVVCCSPHLTHLLGLLLIDGVTAYNLDGFSPSDGNGKSLTAIFNKHRESQDTLACQDALIDAGFLKQARL
jgi:hypothetical protein